jgi:diguanylate cyclase (GGDEF)-like protein
MNYNTVSIICIISLIIGIVSLYESELYTKRQNLKLMSLAGLIMLEVAIDTIALNINGKYPEIHKSLKIVEFCTVPIIPTLLSSLVARKRFWKRICKFFYLIIAVNAIAQIITIYIPFMFQIDNNSNYARTSFTYFYAIALILCFALLLVSSYRTFIQNNLKISLTLISINVLLLVGMVIRYFNIESNADWLCIAFGYYIFIIDFSNSYLKIDPITSLLNRRAFSNKLTHINYDTALIVIDANDFKKINDAYGHQSGDWALAKIAESIMNIYSNIGRCYRIGGDEFCVILKPNMLKKLTFATKNKDTYAMLDRFIRLLDEELSNLGKQHKALAYGVSQGYGIYYSLNEIQEFKDYMSIDEVFKLADERMYEMKEKRKKDLN